MKTELKTALVMGIILVVAIGGASAYFSSLEPQIQKSQNQSDESSKTQKMTSEMPNIDKSRFKKAPELTGISGYINTTPEELKVNMKDKVILYDFWTYSCINCIRTLPYISAWNTKYADQGLLIIGIHSPEFEFEKDFNNVQTAVKQYNIS
ncbi:MAG: thiol-disulfide isomerase, partial [Nitrosopumilaceae archaeon]